MSTIRKIRRVYHSHPATEGAGVHLKRAFGSVEAPLFDPFLMLDDFRARRPEDYEPGFPWHPHRGIETVTYVLQGDVEHGDSLGNEGVIAAGDVQWMTAGSGIIHQEMPHGDQSGAVQGFQLWMNLPASMKMTDPLYRSIPAAEIPVVRPGGGAEIRVISGRVEDSEGPVKGTAAHAEFLDVSLPPHAALEHPVHADHAAIAYVIGGEGYFDEDEREMLGNETLVLFGQGDRITVKTAGSPVRFLFLSGKPIGEPIAWRGPIVMNTQEELREAFAELDLGTFIRPRAA